MNEASNGTGPEMETLQVPKGQARLIITLVNGQVSVQGPIENKTLCYGLLETARDAIQEHAQRQGGSRIVRPF